MESLSETFKPNDFVWAKMAGYPPWPGIVMRPDPHAPPKQKDTQWIYFFGSHNYAWIEEKHIKPFEPYKEQYKMTYKQATLREAVKELEDIIEKMNKDPDYKIDFVKYLRKDKKSTSPKKPRKSSGSIGERKRSLPLKEKNTSVPKKKSRSSISAEVVDAISDRETPLSKSLSENHYGPQEPKTLNTTNIATSTKTFGFLAANIYAEGIIRNLIKSGHRLQIWSRNSAMCEELQEYADQQQTYFKICNTPREVVRNSDITFSCLSDPDQPKATIQDFGITDENDDLLNGKGYVEMTSIDPETSKDLCELIKSKGGVYLEAMVQGSRQEANKGELIVLSAGKQPLFVDCQSCFKAMGKASFLLGRIGSATKIHMIFQVMRGVFLAALVEGFAMADRCGIMLDTFHNIFNLTQMSSDYLQSKADVIVGKKFLDTQEPIQQLQKDLAQGLEMSNKFRQPMPLASNANEILKHARRLGCDNQDSACIYNHLECVTELMNYYQIENIDELFLEDSETSEEV